MSRGLVAVNVGATRPQKRWFAESFAETLDQLGEVACVIVGAGKEDHALAEDVLRRTVRAQPVSLVGQTDVKTLAAILQCSDVLLSADSGPMHLATAVGTPCVALFGSTDPAVTGPFDNASKAIYKSLLCAPCGNHPTCDGRYDCLRAISPDEVALEINGLLRRQRSGFIPLLSPMAEAPPRAEPASAVPAKRILISTKFRFIGDTLLAIPIFRAARAQWPDAHIALLTGKNARVLLQNNPYLDEIMEFDPYKADRGTRSYVKLVQTLRQGKFDLSLALNRSFHSALTSWLGRVGIRAGFESEGRGPLLNRRVDYDREKSEIACYFDVLRAVAPDTPVNPALELWISGEEAAEARARLAAAWGEDVPREQLVGIQPGASQPGKRWSTRAFASVVDALVRDNPRVFLAVIGGPDEKDAADEMLGYCLPETRARAATFAGRCSLRGSLALVSELGLFVGNDTAIMHSAVALGVPTVALFGPTNPRKWGNYGPCHRVLESPDGLMASLDVEEVRAAVQSLLTQPRVAVGAENPV